MVLRLKIRGEDKQNFVEFAVLLSLAVTGILTLKKNKNGTTKSAWYLQGVFFLNTFYILFVIQ